MSTTPNVELHLMLDGTIEGYESYESTVEAQSSDPLDEARIAGMDMLYSSGTTGMPKGITRAFPNEPLEEWNNGVTDLCQLLFGVDDTKTYLSPAPFYHAAPLRFCMAQHALGATIVAMENFDAERTYSSSMSTTSRTAGRPDDVRAHAQTRRGNASQVRRVVTRVRHSRRSPVPRADQEGDDRVVRSGHP